MIFKLFYLFTKIGIFTIGGGYAVIPLIEKDIVGRKWLSQEELYELVAVTESLPGVFATNIAALVGYRVRGLKGGIVAALGTIIAPFCIIVLIAMFFQKFQENEWVARAFKALRPAVVALIIAVGLQAVALGAVAGLPRGWLLIGALLAVSRWLLAPVCVGARVMPGSSLGAVYAGAVPGWQAALLLSAGLVALVSAAGIAGISWWWAAAAWSAGVGVAVGLRTHAHRTFEGINGDVLGAVVEWGWTVGLVVLACL